MIEELLQLAPTELIALSIFIFFSCLFIMLALTSIFSYRYYPYSGDEQTCEQMRKSKWTEKEIEYFMNTNRGLYYPPVQKDKYIKGN